MKPLPPPTLVNLRSGAAYDQYIGLGTMWGNKLAGSMGSSAITRSFAIEGYEKRLRALLEDAGWRVELKALSGKVLGCHCSPRPCHGEVIIRLFLELWGPNGRMISGDQNDPCAGKSSPEGGSCE